MSTPGGKIVGDGARAAGLALNLNDVPTHGRHDAAKESNLPSGGCPACRFLMSLAAYRRRDRDLGDGPPRKRDWPLGLRLSFTLVMPKSTLVPSRRPVPAASR
jgi:hypothetical protein